MSFLPIPGPPGTSGTPGVNAFTTTTEDVELQSTPEPFTVSVPVLSTAWMVQGQPLYSSDGVHFARGTVETLTSPTTFDFAIVDCTFESILATGAKVSPLGVEGPEGPPGPVSSVPLEILSNAPGDDTQTDNGGDFTVIPAWDCAFTKVFGVPARIEVSCDINYNGCQFDRYIDMRVTVDGIPFGTTKRISVDNGTATSGAFPINFTALGVTESIGDPGTFQVRVEFATDGDGGTGTAYAAYNHCTINVTTY